MSDRWRDKFGSGQSGQHLSRLSEILAACREWSQLEIRQLSLKNSWNV